MTQIIAAMTVLVGTALYLELQAKQDLIHRTAKDVQIIKELHHP